MDVALASAERESESDGPWPLPEGWCWTRFGTVLPIAYGKALPHRARTGSGEFAVFGSSGPVGSHDKFIAPADSIVIGRKGSAGSVFYSEKPSWPIDTAYFTSGTTAVDPRFGYWFLLFRNLGRLDQSTAIPSLSRDIYDVQPIPIAPLAEQRRIMERVDALFTEIAKGEAALAAARKGLDNFRRALLKAAVTGELTKDWREKNPVTETGHDLLARIAKTRAIKVPTTGRRRRAAADAPLLDTSTLPPLPEGWAWERLSALGDFGRGKSRHRPRDDARLYGGSTPFIQTGVVANSDDFIKSFQQTYSEFGVAQSRVWPPGTVCITIAANIAKTAITTFNCCFPDSIVGLTPVSEIDPYWVHTWIKTIQQRLERFAPATAQKNINLEVLDGVAVPIPPPAEAAEILRRVSETLAAAADTMAMLDAEAADAARLKQSVLKAAFEGRLTQQDPADEPASTLLARLKTDRSAVTRAKPSKPRRHDRGSKS